MIFKILLILLAFGGTRVPAFDIVGSDPYSYEKVTIQISVQISVQIEQTGSLIFF